MLVARCSKGSEARMRRMLSRPSPAGGPFEPLPAVLPAMDHRFVFSPRVHGIAIRLFDHRVRTCALPLQLPQDHPVGLGTVHALHAAKAPGSEGVRVAEPACMLVGIGHRQVFTRWTPFLRRRQPAPAIPAGSRSSSPGPVPPPVPHAPDMSFWVAARTL